MRRTLMITACCWLAVSAASAQAKPLSKNEQSMCSWGSEMAGNAQKSKLSGISLYSARKQLQVRRFTQPWMRMMAMGITEQTYNSASRLKPGEIRQTYYQECLHHLTARR